jgi:nucleoside phosphorylase
MMILVPQGAEYRAVCRGVMGQEAIVRAIPVGIKPVERWLAAWRQELEFWLTQPARILVMGLCGSLSPDLAVGDPVLYRECRDLTGQTWPCQPVFFPRAAPVAVTALTSDRLIATAQAKQHLATTYNADVVDMEGAAILRVLAPLGIAITMVRVVSDDAHHDLPDIGAAIDVHGNLQPWPLALGMMRRPIAASRLIRGSLQGLNTLQHIAAQIT